MRKPKQTIKNDSLRKRTRRKLSIRSTLIGTTERPRLCVIRSNKHLLVQVVDDSKELTIFTVSTYGKSSIDAKPNKEGAVLIGKAVAEKLKQNSYTNVLFDRNGFQYTGVIAALADSVRENGIKI